MNEKNNIAENGPRAPVQDQGASAMKGASKKIVANGVLLTVIFWGAAAWLLGSVWHTPSKAHQVSVYVVDFDNGPIGQALLAAVQSLQGQSTYPNFDIVPAASTSPEDITHRVWQGKAWGAIYASANASSLYEAAIGSETAATTYNPETALVYTGLEVRYYSFWSSVILSTFKTLQVITLQAFDRSTVVPYLASLNGAALGPNQALVLAAPIAATYENLTPLPQGIRSLLNTIFFVYPTLFQFFFILGVNGILGASGIYARCNFRSLLKLRLIISIVWPLFAGLSVAGWQFTFKESFPLSAKQVFALWALYWVLSMVFFDMLDALSTFVPLPLLPCVTIFVIIIGVSATIFPVDYLAHFYRIHYAVPTHSAWEATITIYGRGAANKLYYDLPILAAWLVAMKAAAVLATWKRANDAHKARKARREAAEQVEQVEQV